MRKEKGGKRGKKKMDERQEEREKEGGEVEERTEERTEEGTEETEERRILRTLKALRATVDVIHYPEDQPLLPRTPIAWGYCQQPLNRHLVLPKQQLAAVMSTTHPAPLALETLHQF